MHTTISNNIRFRRSIFPKMYSGEQVPEEVIKEMLENANWAPTHKFTEPWRFTVFSGDGLRKLADHLAETYKKHAEANNEFDSIKHEKFKTKALLCSHVISLGMKRNSSIPEFEEVSAVACAAQNMMLTASSHAVGCYWTTGGFQFYDEAKYFFGLEQEDKLLGFLFIGIPKKDLKAPKGFRKPIEDKVQWVK